MINKAKLNSQNRIDSLSKPKIRIQEKQPIESKNKNIAISVNIPIVKKNELLVKEYYPIVYLSKHINSEEEKYKTILDCVENFNIIFSDYMIKKKINEKSIEIQVKNEEIKKEKEKLMIKKNLDEKVDSVLEKANMALNNMSNLGKVNNKKFSKLEFEKEKIEKE